MNEALTHLQLIERIRDLEVRFRHAFSTAEFNRTTCAYCGLNKEDSIHRRHGHE